MTTITPSLLAGPVVLGTVDASVYSPPTNTTAQISRAVFCNTTSSAVTLTAGLTTGGALGASNTMISPISRILAPGESYISPEFSGLVIPPNLQLHAYAGTASAVTFTASGVLIQ